MPRGFRGFLVGAGAFVTAGFRFPDLAFAELMFSVNFVENRKQYFVDRAVSRSGHPGFRFPANFLFQIWLSWPFIVTR